LRQANAEPLDYLLLKNPRPGTIWPIRKVWNDLIRLQDLGNRRVFAPDSAATAPASKIMIRLSDPFCVQNEGACGLSIIRRSSARSCANARDHARAIFKN
jgi:hypothetical protein